MSATIPCTLNGRTVALGDGDHLLDVLRNEHALHSVRFGCGQEQCGACHVLVDGHSVPSCTLPPWAVANKEVVTLELAGLASRETPPAIPPPNQPLPPPQTLRIATVLHALQDAFVTEQAAQCGYCTSGILMSAAALLLHTPQPDDGQIRAALERHLCRCGAHLRILRAVARASRALQTARP